ncbi:MAG: glycyl-radical enzyme activating protein [Clostridia bacterium]|nr:glycyl-radical enzyme activating protein [Clostridia bacterium]
MNEKIRTVPVGSIQKFSVEDGPGIRTTVFLKGCPLRCQWCHNPEMIDFNPQLIRLSGRCIHCGYCIEACQKGALYYKDGQVEINWDQCDNCLACIDVCYADALKSVATEMTVQEIVAEAEKDKGFYDHTGGGMTISGGEMLSRPEVVAEIISLAEKRGICICLDTSGYGSYEALHQLAASANVTDILYDMKCIFSDQHIEKTGVDNHIILDNLTRLASEEEIRKKIMMRMPLIKEYNDTDEMIHATADFYDKNNLRRVTLLPYHKLGVSKSERIGEEAYVFDPPSKERIDKIREIFEARGMDVSILGE